MKFFIILAISLNIYALEIAYSQRAPYIVSNQNSISGLVATPLIKALDSTDIKYTLKEKSVKRLLAEVKANKEKICIVGWFKTPKREKFALYTKPLYQDKPMGILTNSKSNIKENIKIDELLNTKDISILQKSSYSYGDFIDKKIKISKIKIKKTPASNKKMISMIAKKRATFMFISPEESQVLLKNHKYKKRVRFVHIQDMMQGNKRYLLCSKKVEIDTINQINSYLK